MSPRESAVQQGRTLIEFNNERAEGIRKMRCQLMATFI